VNAAWRFSLIMMVLLPLATFAGQNGASSSSASPDAGMQLTAAARQKIGSGRLLQHLTNKYSQARTMGANPSQSSLVVAIYAYEQPTQQVITELARMGAQVRADSWIPPMKSHPLGVYLARVPVAAIADVLGLGAVKRMDTAEAESVTMNNSASHHIRADLAWDDNLTGSGVTVGVIDAGLDVSYAGTDLPAGLVAKDYSVYPPDNTVANPQSGHGTHVTGTILGRGLLSASNTANGGGAYKGIAPGAGLVFLKVQTDNSALIYDWSLYDAIHAAADVYGVDVLNLSIGGWDAHHDGTSLIAQAIDYAFSKGVVCIVAAGNNGNSARHASGSVAPNSMSDLIPIDVAGWFPGTMLKFNLVWSDGTERKNLSLLYYDRNGNQIPAADIDYVTTTESTRGTESQFSSCRYNVGANPGTYYVRVVNPTATTQSFHIYEDYRNGCVKFVNPDPNSTLSTPGDADNAFTVGAYVSRTSWTSASLGDFSSELATEDCASYSGRGPSLNGTMKPNVSAPGTYVISLRDRDTYTSSANPYWIDNDGTAGGAADYIVMEGTSMAAPVCAGAAAILLQQSPALTPAQVYEALTVGSIADVHTGSLPNTSFGFGKLDVKGALEIVSLPVELTSFTSSLRGGTIVLSWRTATETNNYGFEIEKREVSPASAASAATAASGAGWMKIGFVPGSGTSNSAHDYSFIDKPAHAGTYEYRLKQIDRDGKFEFSRSIEVAAATGPLEYSLSQNYPNPFNPSTTMRFSIGAASHVRLAVYDILGREVAVLADGAMQPGSHSVEWNASSVPSGVYFYRIDAGGYSAVKKLLLQK